MKRVLLKAIRSYSTTINPATGREIEKYDPLSTVEVESEIDTLWNSYAEFGQLNFSERQEYLTGVCENLGSLRDEAAEIMSLEMGKPLAQSYGEVDKCVSLMEFYLKEGEDMLADVNYPYGVVENSKVVYEPLGIIFQLAPFNFPFWQVIRFCFPAMVVGNTIMMRHSHSCAGNGEIIEQVFDVEGWPKLFSHVVVSREDVTETIIPDPRVRGVAFTGSAQVGRIIAATAGAHLKKSVVELGGSDAFVVCEDADIDSAVEAAIMSRIIVNSGQSCNAAKRIMVQSNVIEEFTGKMVERVQSIKFGDPFDEESVIGPLAREDLMHELDDLVQAGIKEGAQLLCGGNKVRDNGGFYYEPTVLSNVSPDTPSLFFEETFGPAMPIIEFSTDEEAIELANMSTYGLSGVVFSADAEKAEKMVRRLEVGLGYVNRMAASNWALPFGGFPGKESGYGRECGLDGLREWCNVKTLML